MSEVVVILYFSLGKIQTHSLVFFLKANKIMEGLIKKTLKVPQTEEQVNILNSIKKLNWPTKLDKWTVEPEDGHTREKQRNVRFHTL